MNIFEDTHIVEGCQIKSRNKFSPELLIPETRIKPIDGLSLLDDPICKWMGKCGLVNAGAPLLLKGNSVMVIYHSTHLL